jgi:hypothetical protein
VQLYVSPVNFFHFKNFFLFFFSTGSNSLWRSYSNRQKVCWLCNIDCSKVWYQWIINYARDAGKIWSVWKKIYKIKWKCSYKFHYESFPLKTPKARMNGAHKIRRRERDANNWILGHFSSILTQCKLILLLN